MIFTPLAISGACLVEAEPLEDERGYFARTWSSAAFEARGMAARMEQASISYNRKAGTLRGMHFARAPANEAKLIRCERGSVYDVLIDLRPASLTFCKHSGIELTAGSHNAVYVPPGCAHGFQTLEDDCVVAYMMSEAYRPDLAAGVRFDDPAFSIDWPRPITTIAERDRAYPDFDPGRDTWDQFGRP